MKTALQRAILAAFSLLFGFYSPVLAQTVPQATPDFAGKYADLLTEQKRLVDDWMRRFSDTIRKPVAPAEGYNNLPVSTKTTFYGVTHALIKTGLTEPSGNVLGESAIAIVDKVDSVAGDIPGSRGDEQFRIYVQLRPGAQELLAKSQEFGRRSDNTIYHKDYPICFRGNTGTPSIQVSITRDGKRADIDVDYRSVKFPVCLVNGHYSASNSDVRVGNNDERHNRNWAGMQNWWRSLLGLPLLQGDAPSEETAEHAIPREPRTRANERPEVAVLDFLNSWLVEQKPNQTMAYFAEPCFACMEIEAGQPIDRGMAKFKLLQGMMEANRQIGKISSLSEVSFGIRMTGPRVKVIKQPDDSRFVLYDIREDAAEQFLCPNQLDSTLISAKALQSKAFGKYVGALFQLKAKEQEGRKLFLLWAKEGGYWKIVSYGVDPIWEKFRVPGTSPEVEPALPVVQGDKQLVPATTDFLKTWFVSRQLDRAHQYISARCNGCVNVFRDDSQPKAQTPKEAENFLREAMKQLAEQVGQVNSLADALEAPQPHHEDLKLVKHPDAKAFVIASVPDYMAEAADCSKLAPGGVPNFVDPGDAKKYGNYYAVALRLKKGGPGADVLWLLWAKEGGTWKIISYLVMEP